MWDSLNQFLQQNNIPPAVGIVCCVLVFVLVFSGLMKLMLLRSVPMDPEFIRVPLEDFPDLDTRALLRYSRALEALGLKRLLDYTPATESSSGVTVFARLFVHREHHCYATIIQAFAPNISPRPIQFGFLTLFEDGWSLASGNWKPNGISYSLRRPRRLGCTYPESTPAEVLEKHLKRRQEMIEDLGVVPEPNLSADDFFDFERQTAFELRRTMWRKPVLWRFLEMWLFSLNPKYQWLGDYRKLAARRKQS